MTETFGNSLEKGRQRGFRRFFIAIVLLASALAIIVLAWPRLIAGVAEDPLEESLHTVIGPNPAPQDVVVHLLMSKEQVTLVHATSKTWADIGFLRLQESMLLGPLTPDGQKDLDGSITAHQAALSYDPNNAYAWTRLAQAMLVRYGMTADRLGPILTAAVKFSPYDSQLVIARVDIALAMWNQLSDGERTLMDAQIHLAADQSPTALANITRERFALTRIIDSLSDSPRLLKRFVYAYTQ